MRGSDAGALEGGNERLKGRIRRRRRARSNEREKEGERKRGVEDSDRRRSKKMYAAELWRRAGDSSGRKSETPVE